MKPKLLFTCLLLGFISLSAFAQKAPTATNSQTAFRFAENFSSLVIDDELAVTLVEGTSNEITIDGDAQSIVASESDGCLYLSARPGRIAAGTKVYVPSNGLSKISLMGKAVLGSAGVLPNAKIAIHLAAEAKINVKSTGRIDINTVDEIRFVKTTR